jgi:hypothetical protein
VAHMCNPSYSGEGAQEDTSSKPAQANSSQDSISKIHHKKRTGRMAQGIVPEFKPKILKKSKYSIKFTQLR